MSLAGLASRNAAIKRRNKWETDAVMQWHILKTEPLFVLGIGLYWGEGDKTHNRFRLTNSDPQVIATWIKWCNKYMPEVVLKLRINICADTDPDETANFWRKITGVHQLTTRIVTSRSNSSKRKLLYGTVNVLAGKGSREYQVKMRKWIELAQKI